MKVEIFPLEKIRIEDNEIDDSEAEFGYSFLNESIGLWRKDSKSRYWDTIGLGIKDYYRF